MRNWGDTDPIDYSQSNNWRRRHSWPNYDVINFVKSHPKMHEMVFQRLWISKCSRGSMPPDPHCKSWLRHWLYHYFRLVVNFTNVKTHVGYLASNTGLYTMGLMVSTAIHFHRALLVWEFHWTINNWKANSYDESLWFAEAGARENQLSKGLRRVSRSEKNSDKSLFSIIVQWKLLDTILQNKISVFIT